jgi:SAM-dependent methyltransferase
MTPQVLALVRMLALKGKVLDVGSFDVNGCVREYFEDYTGVDMRPGPNVDKVCNAECLPFEDNYFDHVLCLESLEHMACFWLCVDEMKRVLKPGGTLVLTAAGNGFQPHDFPSDYWRFLPAGLEELLKGMEEVTAGVLGVRGVFATAKKTERGSWI